MDDKLVLRVRKVIGDMVVQYDTELQSTARIHLQMLLNQDKIEFYSLDMVSSKLGHGDTYLLSSEVAGGFTGVYVGMFNDSKSSETNASFNFFTYRRSEQI
jgi:alpha-N-arabinofuranosidase